MRFGYQMAADPERRMSVDVSEKAGFGPADLIRPAPFDAALPPLRCRRLLPRHGHFCALSAA